LYLDDDDQLLLAVALVDCWYVRVHQTFLTACSRCIPKRCQYQHSDAKKAWRIWRENAAHVAQPQLRVKQTWVRTKPATLP